VELRREHIEWALNATAEQKLGLARHHEDVRKWIAEDPTRASIPGILSRMSIDL
jgi:hypothetical protein